jgi:hypothetical protein
MTKIVGTVLIALALSLTFTMASSAAPTCKTGKPCGDTCIAKDKECHTPKAKECKTGKPCGDTCIAKDKQCTK